MFHSFDFGEVPEVDNEDDDEFWMFNGFGIDEDWEESGNNEIVLIAVDEFEI